MSMPECMFREQAVRSGSSHIYLFISTKIFLVTNWNIKQAL